MKKASEELQVEKRQALRKHAHDEAKKDLITLIKAYARRGYAAAHQGTNEDFEMLWHGALAAELARLAGAVAKK